MWKHVLVVLAGVWLIFSAFAWPHPPGHVTNTWMVGGGLVLFGALSTIYPWARAVSVALSVWLFLYAIIGGPTDPLTFWNDALVALVVFVLGMLESQRTFHTPPAERDQMV